MSGNAIQDAAWGYNGATSGDADEFAAAPEATPDTNLRDGDQFGIADNMGNVKALNPEQGNQAQQAPRREIGPDEAVKIRASNAQLAAENARLREDSNALKSYLAQTQQMQQQTLSALQQQMAAQTPQQQAETRQRILDMVEEQGIQLEPAAKALLNTIDTVNSTFYSQQDAKTRAIEQELNQLKQFMANSKVQQRNDALETQWNQIIKDFGQDVAQRYAPQVGQMVQQNGVDINTAWKAVATEAIVNRALTLEKAKSQAKAAEPLAFLQGSTRGGGGQLSAPAYVPGEDMAATMRKIWGDF